MKKSILVASLLAIALAACGKKEEAAPAADVSATPAPAASMPTDTTMQQPAVPAVVDAAKSAADAAASTMPAADGDATKKQ